MDLRNLCSKLDMDAIRAKIPPLPQIKLPKSMSKLKSRKIFRSSRENINSVSRSVSSKRKQSNCENLARPFGAGAPYAVPTSGLVNPTPNRISTVSSLMNRRENEDIVSTKWKTKKNEDENFYRSAGGIEDYYPSPLNERFEQRISRPISPVRVPPIPHEILVQSEQNIKMSFGERLQKGYKDATEFKLKHLFAKRTVVRSDKIEITEYIHRFDEDRLRDEKVQQRIDREVADNYRFEFKVSQQKSEESFINSPAASSQQNIEYKKKQKTVSELSGDESGMESSPPARRQGIASTRFSRVRQNPLNMSLEENSDDGDGIHMVEEEISKISERSNDSRRSSYKSKKVIGPGKLSQARHSSLNMSMEEDQDSADEIIDDIELNMVDVSTPKIKPNASSLYDIKRPQQTSEMSFNSQQSPRRPKSIRERMSRFTKQKSEGDEKKPSPQTGEENEIESSSAAIKSDKPFETIKQNFKRLQKSIKLPQQLSTQSTAETENDGANSENKTILSRTQQFSERIKRFRSTEQVNKISEDDENKESPIHKIASKLQEWKKSIKKKVDLHGTDNEEEYEGNSSQKPSLMMKLKHIRSRKSGSTEDPDDDEEGGETYKESLAARAKLQLEKGVVAASQVPQKTIKKISDTKKYFKKKQENSDKKQQTDKSKSDEELEQDDSDNEKVDPKPVTKRISRPPPPIPRPYFHNTSEEEDSDDNQTFMKKSIAESQLIAVPTARAVWTTKRILSDDAIDYDDELPRVLLHQDNSDGFESTLIIAVTRPISRTTTPIITELPPDSTEESAADANPDNWIPNQDVVATFLEMTPPSQRKHSKDSNATPDSKDHSRQHSIDSSSEDSWIKDIPRGPSIAVPSSIYENEKPWKIQKANPRDSLYKTKSIDLFEMQKKHGGVLTAFEDFDDELKNTPVFKIENKEPLDNKIPQSADHYDRESSEEFENPDDDNSSRVTRISVHPQETEHKDETELKPQPYGNSRESLAGYLDGKNVIASDEADDYVLNNAADDENESHEKDEIKNDGPPSKAPSPPSSTSPTPPPLPQRRPSMTVPLDFACPSQPPPPLPLTRPPVLPSRPSPPAPPPPKIPDRNPITTRISKPLVKTASLRLAYSEQVNPEDIGKVNKLISRFEPDVPKYKPKIITRKPWIASESEEYSDEEDSFEILPTKQGDKTKDTTPTNHPRIQKSYSIDSIDLPNNNEKITTSSQLMQMTFERKATSQIILDNSESAISLPSISVSSSCLDVNSNFSQPSSVYGSPLPYPSSLVGSTEVTPLTNRKESEHLGTRRNRRSLARDDEHFYSFDSDEENSYYSISSTSSNRYVIEL